MDGEYGELYRANVIAGARRDVKRADDLRYSDDRAVAETVGRLKAHVQMLLELIDPDGANQ
jgi:hypothetical protein